MLNLQPAVSQIKQKATPLVLKLKSSNHDSDSSSNNCYYRDLFPDTWVGIDALGRTMPTSKEVGALKNDKKTVGIFYITWHRDSDSVKNNSYVADISKILKKDPNARLDINNPLWEKGRAYHWGEPEMGYFLSRDEYVIRHDISMLSDAGVDVLIMDVTNAVSYWEEWETLFTVMEKMKAEGNKVPKFCFWAFNGAVITVVQDLYEKIYKKEKYKDLWFYWEGKPLLIYNKTGINDVGRIVENPNHNYDPAASTDKSNPHYGDADYTEKNYKDYTSDVKNFFTNRTMWWGFYEWNGKRFIGTEDNWSYGYQLNDERIKKMPSDSLISRHNGKMEQAAVTPAQHPPSILSMAGKSWSRKYGEPNLNEYDLPITAYVPWLGKTVEHPESYGIYFQERWDEALKSDPPFIYINDWNEWKAEFFEIPDGGKTLFMRRQSSYFFVDQYNSEFNRDIQPMKDGYTDNYYMQMAQNIRRYKGVRPTTVLNGFSHLQLNGDFSDWNKIRNEYRDTKGDTFHRDYNGYYGRYYKDTLGRNDIITCKVAVDRTNVYFLAETDNDLTTHTGHNWMLLLIDADKNPKTGWYGYDYIINKSISDNKTTTLMQYDSTKGTWVDVAKLNYRYKGKSLEVAVPRKLLGLKGNAITFDFHWVDNPTDLKDPISLCTAGDSAPNRRFNYRFAWEK